MSSLFDYQKKLQENSKNKYGFVIFIIFMVWLFYPNYSGFIQSCYWADNILYSVLRVLHINKTPEYIHYRNNAVYLTKAYPKNPAPAYREIDRAIASFSGSPENGNLSQLYKDAALIKLYYGDKKGALTDLQAIKNPDTNDNLRMAILLADESKFKEAETYCKTILAKSSRAVSGYVCRAYVYEKSGDVDSALQLYDYLAELKPNSEVVFMERSYFKKRNGDTQGALEDINKAKSISSYIPEDGVSILDKTINIKDFPLSII